MNSQTTAYRRQRVRQALPVACALVLALAPGLRAQSTGSFMIVSGTLNLAIPDSAGPDDRGSPGVTNTFLQNASGAPAGAVVSGLKYRLRIHNDNDPTEIYHRDFTVRITSQTSGEPGALTVYEKLGAKRDDGHDDDDDVDHKNRPDRDIELEWRSTVHFNGQNPNQRWFLILEDYYEGDAGFLEYIEFEVFWRIPGRGAPEIVVEPTLVRLDPAGGPGAVPAPASKNRVQQESAMDPSDPKQDFGEVLTDEVVVRFDANVAPKLHARLLDGAAKRLAGKADILAADDEQAGILGLPDGVIGLASMVSGHAQILKALGRHDALKQAVERRAALTDAQRTALAEIVRGARRKHDSIGLFSAKLRPGTNLRDICMALQRRADVVFAHPSPVCRVSSTPNDPYFPNMWNLPMIKMPGAWGAGANTLSDIRVCVVDTGVRMDHLDLVGRLVDPKDVYPNDGDAYADALASNDDPDGHGTACAGIIAAIRDNNYLISGIAPVNIIPVNAAKYIPEKDDFTVVNHWEGIKWGVNHGASVISCSYGGRRNSPMPAEQEAIDYAQAHGVLVVAAAGNTNITCDTMYPAAMPYCISVGAIDDAKRRVNRANGWTFDSSTGRTLDLCAPGQGNVGADANNAGVSIITLGSESSGDTKRRFKGTSAAAPHVAGLCAFLKHVNPGLTAAQIRAIVEGTAVDRVGAPLEDTQGKDIFHGHGLINAEAAIAIASTNMYTRTIDISNTGDDVLNISNITSSARSWLTVSPSRGAILGPGESLSVLAIINLARALANGGQGTITIASDDADEGTMTIPVSVGSDGLPPSVEAATPAGGEAFATTNDTVRLTVSASDADGDALSYAWFFNNVAVPNEANAFWAFLTTPALFGSHEARVEISDGTFTVSNAWTVIVGEGEPGLVGYWAFENGSGSDLSGRGHDLSIGGRVSSVPSAIKGQGLGFRP